MTIRDTYLASTLLSIGDGGFPAKYPLKTGLVRSSIMSHVRISWSWVDINLLFTKGRPLSLYSSKFTPFLLNTSAAKGYNTTYLFIQKFYINCFYYKGWFSHTSLILNTEIKHFSVTFQKRSKSTHFLWQAYGVRALKWNSIAITRSYTL